MQTLKNKHSLNRQCYASVRQASIRHLGYRHLRTQLYLRQEKVHFEREEQCVRYQRGKDWSKLRLKTYKLLKYTVYKDFSADSRYFSYGLRTWLQQRELDQWRCSHRFNLAATAVLIIQGQ